MLSEISGSDGGEYEDLHVTTYRFHLFTESINFTKLEK
jgi:hypothetical protein